METYMPGTFCSDNRELMMLLLVAYNSAGEINKIWMKLNFVGGAI